MERLASGGDGGICPGASKEKILKEKENMAYLFVHFKEKTSPDGEQVYFAISEDGFHWQEVNPWTACALGLLRG